MTEIEKVTNNQAKARSIYNSLIKDNIFYTGISKNLAIALIELGIDSSATDENKVEKLQEQLNTAKKALTEEIESIEKYIDKYGMFSYGANTRQAYLEGLKKALAAIGGDDD
ncbi:hypothetical protein [Lactococcus lactis]|uniref:hypothetical protein n=1 Tax=Lactococcus lactis TaxID=1358 RepID=UPI00384E205C